MPSPKMLPCCWRIPQSKGERKTHLQGQISFLVLLSHIQVIFFKLQNSVRFAKFAKILRRVPGYLPRLLV